MEMSGNILKNYRMSFMKIHVSISTVPLMSYGRPCLKLRTEIYIYKTVHCNKFLFNNQPDTLIIQIYSVIKLYMFRASSLPIIMSFLLYIRHW